MIFSLLSKTKNKMGLTVRLMIFFEYKYCAVQAVTVRPHAIPVAAVPSTAPVPNPTQNPVTGAVRKSAKPIPPPIHMVIRPYL